MPYDCHKVMNIEGLRSLRLARLVRSVIVIVIVIIVAIFMTLCTSFPNSTLRLQTKSAKTSNEFNSSLSREVQLWKGPDGADCPWGTCIVLTVDSVSSLGDDKQSRSTAGCWSKGVHYVEGRGERTRPQACLESGWDTGTVGWYNITIYCCFILNQNINKIFHFRKY